MCVNNFNLNTPRRVANEANNIVWKWESTPFGETKPTGTLEFNLRFAGQYYDNETGTYYNINRDYNPITGRYIQSDPIGLDGGFSTFAYVNGNPVMRIDINGLVDMNFIPKKNVYNQGSFWKDAWKNYVSNPSLYSTGEAFNHDSLFTVLAHGEAGRLFDSNGNEMKQSLLDEIASKAKSSGKNAIWLIACHAGTDDITYYTWGRTQVSTARYLANKSGKNVIAINKYIYFGNMYPFPVTEDSAEWSIWYPEQ